MAGTAPVNTRHSRRLFKIIAVTAGLIIALGIAEGALRIHYRIKQRPLAGAGYSQNVAFCQTWPLPGIDGKYWNRVNYRIKTNNLGFRLDRDLKMAPPPPGVFRVVCMGGSTTFGVGLDNSQTLPVMLEQRLERSHSRSEVINAGFMGHSSPHLVTVFQFRVLPLRPHLLIIYCGNNDMAQCYAPGFKPAYDHIDLRNPTPPWLARKTAIGTFIYQRYADWQGRQRREAAIDIDKPLRVEPVIAGFRRNIESIIILAQANECRVVLMTFTCSLARKISYYARTNAVLRELAAKHQCQLIDLEKLYPRQAENFQDVMHFSVAGEKLRTDIVWQHLEPRLSDYLRSVAQSGKEAVAAK